MNAQVNPETLAPQAPAQPAGQQAEVKKLPIHTKEPVAISAGQQVVYFRRKKVTDDKAFRAVVVAAFTLPKVPQDAPSADVFNDAIGEAFENAASDVLRTYVDANPAATEAPEEMFSFAAIVEQMQAAQTSQRLNGDQIKGWYDASQTAKDSVQRYTDSDAGKKKQAALREKYISLASNNPGIQPELAQKMLAYLAPSDTEHSICKAVAKRLERLTKVETAEDL